MFILEMYRDGILTDGDTRELMGRMKRRNLDLEVLDKYHFPSERRKGTDYFIMTVNDPTAAGGRRQIRSKTMSGLIQKVIEIEAGTYKGRTKTFKQVYERMQRQLVEGIRSEDKLAAARSTASVHHSIYTRYIQGTKIENMPVDAIRKADIEDVVLMNLKRYALRRSTYNDMRNMICMVMRQCYNDELIERNPADRMDWKDRRFTNKLIEPTSIEKRLYTDEEMVQIWDAAVADCDNPQGHRRASSPIASYALRLQMLAGLRRGELCALKWSDMGEDNGIAYIEIQREKTRVQKSPYNPHEYQIIKEHSKTHKNRRVPITEELRELLEEISAYDAEHFPESPFLFPSNRQKDGAIGVNTVPAYLERLCKNLGIPVCKDAIRGTHAFRRNVAKSIGDSEMASKVLGNTVVVLKANYYDGLNLQAARDAMENSPIRRHAGNE